MPGQADDEPPPLPQISLRGLLLANTLIGLLVSFLTTLGMGDVSLGLLVIWGVLAALFLVQWGIFWLLMPLIRSTPEASQRASDPRNAFPPLPREGRGERHEI